MADCSPTHSAIGAWQGLELSGPISGGARTQVYRARRDGDEFVVRTSVRTPVSLDWELDLLEALFEAGVRVPVPVLTDDGRRRSGSTVLHRFIPGRPPGSAEEWRRVVEVLNVVHEVTAGWSQRPGFASARDLLTQDRGGDVDLGAMTEQEAILVRRAWRPVLGSAECAIHGDLGMSNVLVNEEGVALIDWDEARVDVPAFDYAHIPSNVPAPVTVDRRAVRIAGLAWEAASCWILEPEYARRTITELENVSW